MFSLKILDTKLFMEHLLRKDTFDFFELCEASIHTFSSFHIDGTLNPDFFSSDEKEVLQNRRYCTWAEQKNLVFSLVKGHRLPLYLKFVLLFPVQETKQLLTHYHLSYSMEDIHGLYFNIFFEKNNIHCTCGVSMKIFTMDKSLEESFEHTLKDLLKQHQITFEESE